MARKDEMRVRKMFKETSFADTEYSSDVILQWLKLWD
jgi:hypothetical protein